MSTFLEIIEKDIETKNKVLRDLQSGNYETTKATIEFYRGQVIALEKTRRDYLECLEIEKLVEALN